MGHAPVLTALLSGLCLAVAAGADRFDFSRRDVADRVSRARPERPPAWEQLPWTASMAEARRAAAREAAPLFVFTYAGNLRTGRC